MLGDAPLDVVLLATDLDASRDFYRDKVGLEILIDSSYAVTFKCGGDSRLAISKSSAWELRMSRHRPHSA
jgi:catechol-2,3-dioxygenase